MPDRATRPNDAGRERAAHARGDEQPGEHDDERVCRVTEHDVHALHEGNLREHEPRAERCEIRCSRAPRERRIAVANGPDQRRPEQHDEGTVN